MGYFANGCEGDDYEQAYCEQCVHYGDPQNGKGCPVWDAHLIYAYELCNEKQHPGKVMLDMFIPREGVHNQQCRLFVPAPGVLASRLPR